MGFVDLHGHVKVGDNTFVNLGQFKNELTDEWNIYFDDWPLVWKIFSDEGYVTLFAEDRPDISTFNYFGWLRGFKYPPTDHYFRPYWLATYWNFLFRRSTPGCYNEIPAHNLQLNYLSGFLSKYDGIRSFAFYWTQDLSHDYLNAINVADEDYARFFIDNEKHFNNTIVIVFSDHGHRYDSIRETVSSFFFSSYMRYCGFYFILIIFIVNNI
uniref:Sulfatase domain-containing protein n=1 Tax=Ascaris lumbricoides TaxID=6252 RepID=A0A0M3HGC2_ASCLU